MSEATPSGDDAAQQGCDADERQADTPSQRPIQAPVAKSPPDSSRQNEKERPTAVVRYGLMRQIGEFRYNIDKPLPRGTKVVVRTERGVELGEIAARVGERTQLGDITHSRLDEFIEANGPDFPFRRNGKILRIANHQDLIDFRHLQDSAREEASYCGEQIRELKLPMNIISVEHLLGGERIVFCFSAKTRVDFRELVRRLAAQYRTRIEMHQVGARDEARLVADYERCGRRCCCQQFLKDLKPVSMRMAKTQKATLDPMKISGRCGRLMCCLRYEDEGYEELKKKLPKRKTWVRTSDYTGKVEDTQILTQLVRLLLPSGSIVTVANEDIVEYDAPSPGPSEAPQGELKVSEKATARTESAQIGAAKVSNSRQFGEKVMQKILTFVEKNIPGRLIDAQIMTERF